MNENDYVIFDVDTCKFAIPSQAVDKVERAVLLTPVPDAPEPVLGVVSDGGEVVPVLGLRSKIGNEERDVVTSDRMLFSVFKGRKIAILADSVSAVTEIVPDKTKGADELWPGVVFMKSFAGLDADIVLVHDLEALLDPDQEQRLDEAMQALASRGEAEV